MGRLRRYKAHTLEACMEAARRDFGPEALIHAVRTRREGFLLFGRRTIHELLAGPSSDVASIASAGTNEREASLRGAAAVRAYAGVDGAAVSDADRRRTRLLAQAMAIRLERDAEAQRLARANERATARACGAANDPAALDPGRDAQAREIVADDAGAASAPLESSARRFVLVPAERREGESFGRAAVDPRARDLVSAPVAEDAVSIRQVAGDLRSLRELVQRILESRERGDDRRLAEEYLASPAPWCEAIDEARFGAPLVGFYASLIGSRMTRDLARQLIEGALDSLGAHERHDPEAAKRALRSRIAALLPPCLDADGATIGAVDGPAGAGGAAGGARRRPHVVSLVGPTGTGKTTTIAKLAAEYALRRGRRVGLVTTDTFRIGAVQQLRTYADIVGLPLLVADDCDGLRRACGTLADRDVILVDTAGRSHADRDRVAELGGLIRAADPDETHLVLSSTAGEETLVAEAASFAEVGVDRVVLAKLDEAVGFGVLVEALSRIGHPLSWITTGQQVPDDLEPARPERLAELVLGGAST